MTFLSFSRPIFLKSAILSSICFLNWVLRLPFAFFEFKHTIANWNRNAAVYFDKGVRAIYLLWVICLSPWDSENQFWQSAGHATHLNVEYKSYTECAAQTCSLCCVICTPRTIICGPQTERGKRHLEIRSESDARQSKGPYNTSPVANGCKANISASQSRKHTAEKTISSAICRTNYRSICRSNYRSISPLSLNCSSSRK